MNRAWPCVVALALAGACFTDDPQGDGSSASGASATGSSTTSGSTSTGTASTTSGATTGSTTTAESTTTGEVTTTGEATTTTGEATTTTGGLPNPLVFPPVSAVCVLLANSELPYGGPSDCAEVAEAHNDTGTQGLLVADKEVLVAGGREARVVLSFPIPAEVAEQTVVKAELSMVIADGAVAGGIAGELYRVEPFDAESLDLLAPEAVELLDPVPAEKVPQGGTVIRTVPVDQITAGENLYLGVWPTSNDGIVIHDNTWEAERPFLTLTFE